MACANKQGTDVFDKSKCLSKLNYAGFIYHSLYPQN